MREWRRKAGGLWCGRSGLRGLGGVVRGSQSGVEARHQDCDGGVGSSKRRLAANAVSSACVRKAAHLEMTEAMAAWPGPTTVI